MNLMTLMAIWAALKPAFAGATPTVDALIGAMEAELKAVANTEIGKIAPAPVAAAVEPIADSVLGTAEGAIESVVDKAL